MIRVLLVDDDEDLLFIIGEYLNMNGIECHTATSVSRARKRILLCDYDMVISDLQMPGESGLELFRFVSFRHPKLPFILMSGNQDPRIRRQALKMGVYRFLEKPFELNMLKHIITNPVPCETQVGVGAPAA
ncbi:MAG: response regulator [Deltaproteobacteria bacterium]|jgi:DNA-binding NtrC family response regulator|nr:response regulator [Deltaproteobacteria bacterium]MDA8305564.1 response regulator [Deltaproteobacteria bacterium]